MYLQEAPGVHLLHPQHSAPLQFYSSPTHEDGGQCQSLPVWSHYEGTIEPEQIAQQNVISNFYLSNSKEEKCIFVNANTKETYNQNKNVTIIYIKKKKKKNPSCYTNIKEFTK